MDWGQIPDGFHQSAQTLLLLMIYARLGTIRWEVGIRRKERKP